MEQSCFFDLENCQQKERECFESLSDAIQESHEKERARTDQMKYYSRLGSLLGAVFGFLGSNLFLRREVRQHNTKQAERMKIIESALLQLQKQEIPSNEDTSQQDGIKPPLAEKVEQTLMLAETKLGELSGNVQQNAAVLDKICRHLHLHSPRAETVTMHPPSEISQSSSNQESLKEDVIAICGVVAYSVLLALFSLYR